MKTHIHVVLAHILFGWAVFFMLISKTDQEQSRKQYLFFWSSAKWNTQFHPGLLDKNLNFGTFPVGILYLGNRIQRKLKLNNFSKDIFPRCFRNYLQIILQYEIFVFKLFFHVKTIIQCQRKMTKFSFCKYLSVLMKFAIYLFTVFLVSVLVPRIVHKLLRLYIFKNNIRTQMKNSSVFYL